MQGFRRKSRSNLEALRLQTGSGRGRSNIRFITDVDLDDSQVPEKFQVAGCFRFRDISILVSASPTVSDSTIENAVEPPKKRDFSKTRLAFLILFAQDEIKNIFQDIY